MILIITPSVRARDCAQAIQEALREETQVASNLRGALAQLRGQEYCGVVLDHAFLDSDPDESEVILQHIGMAIPIHHGSAHFLRDGSSSTRPSRRRRS